jgi:hypothetical protein
MKDIESIFISSHWFIITGVSIHKKSFELVVGIFLLSIPAIFISVSTAYSTLNVTISGSSINKHCNEANQYY